MGAPVAVRCLTAYIGRHPKREIDGLGNNLPEKPRHRLVNPAKWFFGKIDGLSFHRESGSRVCTVAAGFAAVMHALFAMSRFVVVAAGVPGGLDVPRLFCNEGVLATACVTRPTRNKQAKDREHPY